MLLQPKGSYSNRPYRRDFVPGYREERKPPKSSLEPVRASTSIHSYTDLRNALIAITAGRMDPCQFTTRSGLDMGRLIVTQSLRDRGVEIDISYITRLGYTELMRLNSHRPSR